MTNLYKHNYKLLIDRNMAIGSLLLTVEKQIKDLEIELCVILSANKEILLSKIGEFDNIQFPELINEEIIIENAYFTHNHPQKGFFSIEDIQLAYGWDLEQMRAVAGNNVYKFDKPPQGWKLVSCNIIFDRIDKEVKSILRIAFSENKITREEANKLRGEKVVELLILEFGLIIETYYI